MIILSIETSCDDTGVALLDINKKGQVKTPVYSRGVKILADFVSSQNEIHAPYGGVVPNLAVRAHYKNLPILLEQILAKIDPKKIDLIAVTNGPGLEPCLWEGVNTAKVLARAIGKPIVGVNHLEGHIAANFIGGISNFEFRISNKNSKFKNSKIDSKFKIQNSKLFPAICLIVSGGHTQLVLMKGIGKYNVIGQTRDDAAGEAFDKVAKMLNLGYPGGPNVAKEATKIKKQKAKIKNIIFPRPMINSGDYNFSFSGLKTSVLYLLKGQLNEKYDKNAVSGGEGGLNRKIRPNQVILEGKGHEKIRQNICAAFQQAAVDVLVSKTIKAAIEYKVKTVMLAGGVAANQELQKQMARAVKKNIHNSLFIIPDSKYCTDNAAMIGLAGYWKFKRQGADKIEKIVADSNLNL